MGSRLRSDGSAARGRRLVHRGARRLLVLGLGLVPDQLVRAESGEFDRHTEAVGQILFDASPEHRFA